jgi:hypothetical protein
MGGPVVASGPGGQQRRRTGELVRPAPISRLLVRVRLYPKLLPDVGKFPWVGEAAVGHHLSQRRQASLREEQPGRPNGGIEAHQPPLHQALHSCR